MKTKVKFKIILTFMIMLVGVLVLNTNTVNATSNITDDEVQNMLDLLPDTITLDLKESEYEKSTKLVEEKLYQIWKENNIDTSSIEITIWGYQPYTMELFYSAGVSIQTTNGYKNKTIATIYNNTNNKNSSDETYIKNLKVDNPKYFEVDIETAATDIINEHLFDITDKYYKGVVNDESITIHTTAGSGGQSPLSLECEGLYILFFKDNMIYDIKCVGECSTIGVVTIPSSILESEIEKYTINLINSYFEKSTKEFPERAVKITKGTGNINITNGYTVTYDDDYYDYIIIKQEVSSDINISNSQTDIKLQAEKGVLPTDTLIDVTSVESGDTYNQIKTILSDINKFKIYDITLKSAGVKVQPNGKVKISIPVPNDYDTSRLVVYRISENGEKIEYNVTVENNYATFETDHFSSYVLVEKNVKTDNKEEIPNTKPEPTIKEKDDTPKTGRTNIIGYLLLITTLSGLGIITLKKKTK